MRGARRQRDVEVVRIRVGRRHEALRTLETRPREILVLGAVALDEEHVVLARGLDCVVAVVEHDEGDVRTAEFVGHALPDAAEPADDEVVLEPFDRPPPPPLRDRARHDAAGDRLDDNGPDIAEDRDPAQHHHDREGTGRVVARNRVESGQGRRDHGPVERLEPRLVQDQAEADRAPRERDDRRRQHDLRLAEPDPRIHDRSIVEPWKRTARRSAS